MSNNRHSTSSISLSTETARLITLSISPPSNSVDSNANECINQQQEEKKDKKDLYTEAYRTACIAVQLDRLGRFNEALDTYKRLIQILNELVQIRDSRVEHDQLIQKMNEYVHRQEQLERYNTGIKTPTATHPDAKKHQLYDISDSSIITTTITTPSNTTTTMSSDEEEKEDDIENEEIRLFLQKTQFSLTQGELNDVKEYFEEALEYYLDAADWSKKAYEALAYDPRKRAYARNLCFKAVDKAEEIKAKTMHQKNQLLAVKNDKGYGRKNNLGGRQRASSTSSTRSNHSIRTLDEQQEQSINIKSDNIYSGNDLMTQKLSGTELEVLKYTSNVNDNVFLPWIDDTDLKEKFSFKGRFIDPDGSLRLSDKQMAKFGGWKRPTEFMKHPKLIQLISSTSIVQDVVTDCSFVASLCVAAAYERKFKKQLITSCIYPQDVHGQPCYNPNGKYVIKLVHNGIQRKYMKLMGGYDFPGSSLTGWIPEHIFIYDKHFVADKVWDRILEGSKYGDVLVTVATGELTEAEADRLGLVPTHAYAVIDIKTVLGKRFMQVKNPWSHKRWRGPYSHMDITHWTPELKNALNYDPYVAEQNDDGIFWIDFESVCHHFTSIHLNWNPEPFTHRWVLHTVWPEHIGPKKDIYNLGYNPQFSLQVAVPDKKPAAVWLLLSKHVMITEENTDYITLHVYSNTGGQRIYYPGDPFKEGTYVNSPHILVRFNAPPGTSDYTIVASQHEKAQSLYFSLRAWSLAPFKLNEVPMRYSIEQKIIGQWTEQTAGGNASKASYLNNPQWKIQVPSSSPGEYGISSSDPGLLLMLEAPKSFAVHLMLVEGGKRASSVSMRDILSESGPYRHGFCYCELSHITPGNYTVVASTFEPDLLGQFILTVASNIKVNVDPIPSEGAGMFRKVLHGEWICGYSAMGCPSYGHYGNNPRYLLEIRELTTVKVRLQADKIDPLPSINVTIYEKHPTELFGREVATSGPYTNVIQGVATTDVVLSQNQTGYIIVLATHEKDIPGEFTVTLYSDRPVNVRNDR
ncbi:hypothetical protein INT45_006554 [Circinella minor]|uniref:Calpain catalytic domain-containing protein n=1 Tax=Circinella minor TaxID=1195481 RepID=A0A8H7S1D8_9FUNG|nr:hypothetical protein INT45_006554 [Circinella minor]